jgi:hypothetical protein
VQCGPLLGSLDGASNFAQTTDHGSVTATGLGQLQCMFSGEGRGSHCKAAVARAQNATRKQPAQVRRPATGSDVKINGVLAVSSTASSRLRCTPAECSDAPAGADKDAPSPAWPSIRCRSAQVPRRQTPVTAVCPVSTCCDPRFASPIAGPLPVARWQIHTAHPQPSIVFSTSLA